MLGDAYLLVFLVNLWHKISNLIQQIIKKEIKDMAIFETVNELYLKVTFNDGAIVHAKQGSMVGFQGDVKFDAELLGPGQNVIGQITKQLARRFTGENLPLMACRPQSPSVVYFADMGQHVVIFDLDPGEKIGVESESILAFTDTCKYGVMFLATGVVSQKGLATSTLEGPGQAAILSDGNPIILQGPCNVDPDAMVAFTGPQPTIALDLNLKSIIKRSGESYSLKFQSPQNQVVIQPVERESGLDIGMDGKGGKPQMQENHMFRQGGNQALNTFSQAATGGSGFGNSSGGGGLGGMLSALGGIINS